jgi:predicted O-linked N-acetylglucosamine transferase (SPINDLY family)
MLCNGYVTFGSFNRAPKAGPETIPLWSKLLAAMPNSKLMLKSRGFGDEGSRGRIFDGFAARGLAADRIDLVEASQPLAGHLAMYGQVDIALDTFPYHGTTTTCEAMWMDVPVVSLLGQTHVSRVGLSLMSAVGLQRFCTTSADAYIEAAQELASDPAALRSLRHQLRPRLLASPLCNAGRLTRALEDALRQMFAAWCARR